MGIIDRFKAIKNAAFPMQRTSDPLVAQNYYDQNAMHIQRYIAPIQLTRYRQDIASWRDCIGEAEHVFYPFRVKMQSLYNDTILNGHVASCVQRRKNLTLLKDFALYSGEVENVEATKILKEKWFFDMLNYILEAQLFGYSLISFGDVVDGQLPEIFAPKRANVNPDRQILTSWPYAPSGIQFLNKNEKDEGGNAYYDWTLYVPTPTDVGNSICGYGLLYKVAMYEIILRNIIGWNSDFIETYGQPYRVGKTNKLDGPEADALFNSLKNMGSSSFGMIGLDDEIEFVESKGQGTGWKAYENLEERCEKKISKILLGHADAMDSTPGKLGSGQGEDNPVQIAIDEVQVIDNRFVEHIVNTVLIPKLLKIGIKIPLGLCFKFKNDTEIEETKQRENDNATKIAAYVCQMNQAGWEFDEKELNERLGMKVTKKEVVSPAVPEPNERQKEIANKIKNIYGGHKH